MKWLAGSNEFDVPAESVGTVARMQSWRQRISVLGNATEKMMTTMMKLPILACTEKSGA